MSYPTAIAAVLLPLVYLFAVANAATVTSSSSRDTLLHPLALSMLPARVSIADPSVCLRDVECGPASYCQQDPSNFTGVCQRRLFPGARCSNSGDCANNAYCNVDKQNRCRQQRKLNDTCNPVQANVCRPGLTCKPPTPCVPASVCDGPVGKCRPRNPGRFGAACMFDGDCAQNDGFYCRTGVGRCARKRKSGARCNLEPNNFECEGFCVTGRLPGAESKTEEAGAGVCAPAQPVGGLCTEDSQCAQPFSEAPRADRVMCNLPHGKNIVGTCAKTSQLLRRLGAPCNKKRDLCDAIRGLSCRWATIQSRTVCQQVYDRFNGPIPGESPCTSGSMLSRCPGPKQFYPTECRKRREVPGQSLAGFVGRNDFTTCLRSRRFVPPGSPCDVESVACSKRSVCTVVEGVQIRAKGSSTRQTVPKAVYCVQKLKIGSRCWPSNKFRRQCRNGLQCVNARCKRVDRVTMRVKITHAFLDSDCSRLPCAPGFYCDAGKMCVRGGLKGRLGQLCDENGDAARQCKNGLVCRTQWNGDGVLRCRYAQIVGAYCESNKWCKGRFRCPRVWTDGRELEERRCYDPRNSLWIGQWCNPEKQQFGRRCATVQILFGGLQVTRPLRCMRRWGKKFVCQVEARPFRRCSKARNVSCGDGRFECSGGVCLPRV